MALRIAVECPQELCLSTRDVFIVNQMNKRINTIWAIHSVIPLLIYPDWASMLAVIADED